MTPDELAVAAEMARQDLYFYSRYLFKARKGIQWQRARHHPLVCDALMRVYRGECKRLILNLPPRYSKTQLAVESFVSWCFGKAPDSEFIHTSYSSPLATMNAWQVREVVKHEAYRQIFPNTMLSGDSAAKDHWRTTAGGVMYATGAEGSITGYGAGKMRGLASLDNHAPFGGAIIIDDPHKADEALSETKRKSVINNFTTTIESRKNDPMRTPIIVIMQRLHEEDLAGWLEKGGNGEKWEVVRLSVLDEHDEPIWPEKHDRATLRAMEDANPYAFAGQYRQMPAPPAGGNFNPDKISKIKALPAGITSFVRGWDLAASKDSGAWTVGVKLARDHSTGRTIVCDVVRLRGAPHEVRQVMKATATRDGANTLHSIPQDPGQAGKVQIADFAAILVGHNLKFSPESGDKIMRADPFASQVNVGNVDMLEGAWNNAYVEELRLFPNSAKDQVDASSRAFAEMDNSMERFLALAGR
jgi:predicted phage terminase large subunit-like protein